MFVSGSRTAIGVLLGALLWCGSAIAQPASDDGTRNAARTLAEEGDALLAGGDFAGAVDRFSRAWSLVPAPTIGVRWARALASQDKLIAAEERGLRLLAAATVVLAAALVASQL